MPRIDETWNGRQLDSSVGQRFELALPENPTTGFRWALESNGEPVLTLLGDTFVPSSGPPGAGGVHRWEFEAARAGNADLRLTYRRSWGQAGGAARTFALRVVVAG
ncbi:MAG: protease inhibitor I42 family protein [Chloroflexota bacterium]